MSKLILFFKALPSAPAAPLARKPLVLFFKGYIAPYIRNGKVVAGYYRRGGKAVPVAQGQISLFDEPEKLTTKVEITPDASNLIKITPENTPPQEKNMNLTQEQRQKIAKGPASWAAWRAEQGESATRAEFKELARAGKLDHLYDVQMQADAAYEAEQKAAKKEKNDKWREKNLPKLQAAKVKRIEVEKQQREQWRQEQQSKWSDPNGKRTYLSVQYEQKDHAKENGARWDTDRKQWYHTFPETPAALQRYTAKPTASTQKPEITAPAKPEAPKVRKLPTSGRVSEDDPSIWGSWLLGYEGELWSNIRQNAPEHLL